MNRLKPHLALLVCNVLWAMDYPFYNIVLPHYVHPMAMVSASLVATALFSLVPLLWQKAEKVERADIRKLIGAALLIGVLRKVFIMYGLSMTSPIDGSIIDTIVPLLVLALSVLLGMDRFTRLKITGLVLGMAGAVAVVLAGASSSHAHSHLWGNVMIFLCACVTSVYMVWFKRLIAKYRITTVLRWLYCAAAVMALPFGIGPIVHTDFTAIARYALFPTLFVLTVPTYVPNLMLNYALKTVQPTVSSIYTYLQPVLAIAISVGMGLDKLHADTVVFALVIFAALQCFSQQLIALFLNAESSRLALETGTSCIRFLGWFYILIGLKMATDGVLRGAGDMGAFTAANLVNLTLRVVLAAVLAPRLGIRMVWYAVPVGWAANYLISFLRYRTGRWRERGAGLLA